MKTKTCPAATVSFDRTFGYHHKLRGECSGCGAMFWANREEDALRIAQDHLNPPAEPVRITIARKP